MRMFNVGETSMSKDRSQSALPLIALLGLAAAPGAASAADSDRQRFDTRECRTTVTVEEFEQEEANREFVVDTFIRLGTDLDTTVINEAFSEDYVQHNPNIQNGREPLFGLIESFTDTTSIEMGTVIADGDFVFVNSRAIDFFGVPSQIIVDVFRVEDGITVEHWDRLQPEILPEETVSGTAVMFPIEPSDNADSFNQARWGEYSEQANACLAERAFRELYVEGDLSAIDRYWSADYVENSTIVAAGREGLRRAVEDLPEEATIELGRTFADGDLVFMDNRIEGFTEGMPLTVNMDIVRIKRGKIVEHWEVMQAEVPASEAVNGNAMFPIQ